MRKKYNFSLFYRLFFVFAITVYTSCNLNQPNTTDFKHKTNIKPQIKSFRTKATEDKFYLELNGLYVAFAFFNNEFPLSDFRNLDGNPEINDITKFFHIGNNNNNIISMPNNGLSGYNGPFFYDLKIKRNQKVIFESSYSYGGFGPYYVPSPLSYYIFSYDLKYINLSLTNTEISINAPSSTINVNPTNIDSPWTVTIIGNNDFFVTKTGIGQQNIDFSESGLGKKLNAGKYTITARFDDQAESLESLTITKVGGAAIITKDFYSPYGDAKYSAITYNDPNVTTNSSCN